MEPFDFENPIGDIHEIKEQMIAIMKEGKGLGIAANQVGLDARIIVMGKDENIDILINPVIEDESTTLETHWEGCLSFPGIYVPVERPNWVTVRYRDIDGNEQEYDLEGYDCKCFLHELDHLNGITFNKQVSSLKWNLARKKKKKYL